MNATQQRVLLSFRRAIAFLEARPHLTDPTVAECAGIATQLVALKNTVDRISHHVVEQQTLRPSAMRLTTDEPGFRNALITQHLRPIAQIARGLRKTVPGIDVLRLPNTRVRTATFLEEASTFAKQASVYASVLIEHGLSADFVAQLRSAIDAFQASNTARAVARNDHRGAGESITEEIAVGRRIILMLNGLVSRKIVTDGPEFTVWKEAIFIGPRTSRGQDIKLADEKTPSEPLARPAAQHAA